MIEAKFYRDRNNGDFITGFSVTGHAGFGDHGSDIVCAAASAIMYTAAAGLANVAEAEFAFEVRKDGAAVCGLDPDNAEDVNEKARVILETMCVGLRQLEAKYPGNVKVINEEV